MPAEKTLSKAADCRRSNKPIMEKRRRARINNCLNELKSLILEALKKDPARHSKLEKADILEMTVKHLQNLRRQQFVMATVADPTVGNKYRAGFTECAAEVSRFVGRLDNVENAVRQRLLGHLDDCLNVVTAITPMENANVGASRDAVVAGLETFVSSPFEPIRFQIPKCEMQRALYNDDKGRTVNLDPSTTHRATTLQFVRTRLPNDGPGAVPPLIHRTEAARLKPVEISYGSTTPSLKVEVNREPWRPW